jgi:hypothetical protein
MPLKFVPFEENHLPAISAFNQRMVEGQAASDFLLPTNAAENECKQHGTIQWTRYLILDGDRVCGGVLAMDQPGWVDGRATRAVNFQSPLSEGIVNPKYSVVGLQMVKFMQKQSDAVFMVGMGSADRPLPRLLRASGWSVRPVPFLFRVHRAPNFLRELQLLRTTAIRRVAAGAARFTGMGAVGLAVMQRRNNKVAASIRQEDGWGDWADEIWQRCRTNCAFAVQRDRCTLEVLYPTADPRTKILLIERDKNPVGWSVCFNAELSKHRYFGNLRVASILDCMADPDAMTATAILTDRMMGSQGADLVLVNHSHAAWVWAFRSAGFLSGPSNYMLAMSKRLTELVRSGQDGEERVHVTRGDGDGRIHLA